MSTLTCLSRGWVVSLKTIEDKIVMDLTPGMRLTIKGAAERYHVGYRAAQQIGRAHV